jgi:hypothetical protein
MPSCFSFVDDSKGLSRVSQRSVYGLEMKIKPLQGVHNLVLSNAFPLMALVGITLFFPCLYLSIALESNLAIGGCVAALLLPAVIGARIQKVGLARIPCPDCGRTNMIQKVDSKDQQMLVCANCQVAWRTDLSNHVPL